VAMLCDPLRPSIFGGIMPPSDYISSIRYISARAPLYVGVVLILLE
jgi:hypothetical protein